MAKTIAKGQIGNALTSTAADHILGVANDIFDEKQQRYQQDINADVTLSDDDNSDFSVADPEGNVILELKDGHIKTKNFDSRTGGGGAEVVKAEDGRNILILNKGVVIGNKLSL